VRQSLEQACAGKPGIRILPGAFTQVRQAMAVPARHAAAIPALSAFVEELKHEGFIRAELKRAGRGDLPVAPPEPPAE
jgi:polar amino acid transport system substrate-binding protein